MSVIWNDLQTQLSDYVRTYTTGTIAQGNQDRALNRAIEYFQRRLSLPSDRRIYRFYYTQSTPYYTMPTGFNEAIGLFYDTQKYNIPPNEWTFRPDLDIVAISGLGSISVNNAPQTPNRFWGFTTINQLLQLVMIGPNLFQPQTLDPLTSVGTWTASGDASALAQDTNIYQISPASLKFTITPSGGTATISNTPPGNAYDIANYTQNNGLFQLYVYFGTTNFTQIQIQLLTDASNYWTGTITTNLDGTAWAANKFNLIGQYFNNFVMTGSPNSANITEIKFIFTEGSNFQTVTTMHINNFFVTVPDYMDLVYYSSYKGYVTGSNPKTDILVFNYGNTTTNNNDVLYFGDFAPDLIGPICKRAALELMPQLRQDLDFYKSYRQEVEEWIKIFGKIYPRKREMNFGRTKVARNKP